MTSTAALRAVPADRSVQIGMDISCWIAGTMLSTTPWRFTPRRATYTIVEYSEPTDPPWMRYWLVVNARGWPVRGSWSLDGAIERLIRLLWSP